MKTVWVIFSVIVLECFGVKVTESLILSVISSLRPLIS